LRIGLAYNQRPELIGESLHTRPRQSADPTATDLYVEWDEPGTIAAVEDALRVFGDVVRLEAVGDFASRLRGARVDLLFNMAEGFSGPSREAHVPAVAEFFDGLESAVATSSAGSPLVSTAWHRKADPDPGCSSPAEANAMGAAAVMTRAPINPATNEPALFGIVGSFRWTGCARSRAPKVGRRQPPSPYKGPKDFQGNCKTSGVRESAPEAERKAWTGTRRSSERA